MTPRGRVSVAARAVARHLSDLADVVTGIDDITYTTLRVERVSGTVGAHVRHVLDHVMALVDAGDGPVDYDTRRRGTLVEQHRFTAIAELRRLAFQLFFLSGDQESRIVSLSAVVSANGVRSVSQSTVGRELVFVLSHTVHHQAIIALLLASAGNRTPENFGFAPSTPRIESCAQSA